MNANWLITSNWPWMDINLPDAVVFSFLGVIGVIGLIIYFSSNK